ncbi:MAG: hypothetical protein ACFNS8_04855 [Kingella oralis]
MAHIKRQPENVFTAFSGCLYVLASQKLASLVFRLPFGLSVISSKSSD